MHRQLYPCVPGKHQLKSWTCSSVDWSLRPLDGEPSEWHCSIPVCGWMRAALSGFNPEVLTCEDHDGDGETISSQFILFPEAELSSVWRSKPALSEFSLSSHSENLHSLDFSNFCSSDWWICSLAVWSLSTCGLDKGNDFPLVSRTWGLKYKNKNKAKTRHANTDNWRKNKHWSCNLTSQYTVCYFCNITTEREKYLQPLTFYTLWIQNLYARIHECLPETCHY